MLDSSITGHNTVNALNQIIAARGKPRGIRCDNGYIESFDKRLREACLNTNHFLTPATHRGRDQRLGAANTPDSTHRSTTKRQTSTLNTAHTNTGSNTRWYRKLGHPTMAYRVNSPMIFNSLGRRPSTVTNQLEIADPQGVWSYRTHPRGRDRDAIETALAAPLGHP